MNSSTDNVHIIRRTQEDEDFKHEVAAADLYVLLWSQRQNCFHVERHSCMLESNRRAYAEDRCMDYVTLFLGTHEFCCGMAEKLRGTVRKREEAKRAARMALNLARRGSPVRVRNSIEDILNALDRYASELERRAQKLFEDLDYSAEFPATDAELLREAIQILAPGSVLGSSF